MKYERLLRSVGFATSLALIGCAQDSTQRQGAASTDVDESDKPPFAGMTKKQALARYGEPKTQSVTDEGETWIYVRGIGTAMAKAAIPFYFGGRDIKTGMLIFGADGKVKKYRWDTHTDG